jgi:signal transduction histidine kinase
LYNKNYNWIIVLFLVIIGVDIYYQAIGQNQSLWDTEWFYRRLILLILLTFSLIVYFRIRYLINAKEKKQEFIRRLIETQEAGWNNVSFELHDSIGQNLLVINNDILKITNNLKDGEPAKTQLAKVSEMVLESIDEIRKISSGIYPHQIRKIGLKKAIEAMIMKVLGDFKIGTEINICDLDRVLKNESGLVLYRIIQEAVNNIAKHSKAKNISVNIYTAGKNLTTDIKDDGIGFDFKNLKESNKKGFGLFNMSERAKAIGGKFNIESEPRKGTRIKVLIPIYFNHNQNAKNNKSFYS